MKITIPSKTDFELWRKNMDRYVPAISTAPRDIEAKYIDGSIVHGTIYYQGEHVPVRIPFAVVGHLIPTAGFYSREINKPKLPPI